MKKIRRPAYLVFGALFGSAVTGVDTKQTMAFQVFAFLFFLLLISFSGALFFRARFSAKRFLPSFGTVGQPMTYLVRVKNTSLKSGKDLFLFEEMENPCPTLEEFLTVPEPGEENRNRFDRYMGVYRWRWLTNRKIRARISPRPFSFSGPFGETEVRMECIPVRRGFLRLKGLSVARTDPFGLFFAFSPIPLPDAVPVLPRRYPLPFLKLPGSRRYQAGGVALAGCVGESEEFVSLRDYRPGDPLRRIHWRSWARTGKPVVKEFQEEFFVRYALALDTFQETDEEDDLFEGAVSVAASFAAHLVTGETLLDLLFVGEKAYRFTAGRALGQKEQALKILASVEKCRDKSFSALTLLLTGAMESVSGCVMVLLGWDDLRKELVRKVKDRNTPLRVILMTHDPDPDPGPMKDTPQYFFPVSPDRIEEGLANLR